MIILLFTDKNYKYKEIIMPLLTLTKNSDFNCDWVY